MTDFKTPRIKIVQGWPGISGVSVGNVLLKSTYGDHYHHLEEHPAAGMLTVEDVKEWPVHFRQLLWHEERTDEELLEVNYVKVLEDDHRDSIVPYYAAVIKMSPSGLFIVFGVNGGGNSFGRAHIGYKNCEPCTEQDYLTALK